ncbi:hypothetical protein TWF718_007255 [Orbilia javanica]|uniref:Uncharacterized protein n=1 Tax=Orbilia javanica TaxID=47235 RepID=A0AAN8NVV7_9PEZI
MDCENRRRLKAIRPPSQRKPCGLFISSYTGDYLSTISLFVFYRLSSRPINGFLHKRAASWPPALQFWSLDPTWLHVCSKGSKIILPAAPQETWQARVNSVRVDSLRYVVKL